MGKEIMSKSKIKGYYPLCIYLPPNKNKSFLYIKEHKGSNSSSSVKNSVNNKTLFLTNAPYVRGIRTSLLLKSLFNLFGDVDDVTVVRNARDTTNMINNI